MKLAYSEKENYVHDWTLSRRRGHLYATLLNEAQAAISGNVLMIGCNSGSTLALIREIAPWATVIGLDINHNALKVASEPKIRANALQLPFADGSIDYLFALDIIEHIYESDMVELVDEWARVLSPLGVLMAFSPRTDPIKPSRAAMDEHHVQFFRTAEEFTAPWEQRFTVVVEREQRTNPSGRGAHDAWLMHAYM